MPSQKVLAATLTCLLLWQAKPYALEAPKDVEVIGKTHTTGTFTSLSGPGSRVRNLANTYDMTIFEFGLGGRQASFNGSGITTNTSYPLFDGEALTNNTQVGLAKNFDGGMKAGFLGEFYGLAGDRNVGRVFGQELPWDNFPRKSGVIQPARFEADLYQAFLEGKTDKFTYKAVGGTLTSAELPELSRKDMNQIKLGSLVYRVPITNESAFEKSERKLEEGRHPLKGVDVISDYEYTDKKHIHAEFFTGATEPTPIAEIERDSYGGRIAADVGAANAGFTYVFSDGLRPVGGFGENESVWAIDTSYKLTPEVVPYFTFAETDYERENTRESHNGDAFVAGTWLKFPNAWELKGQYQNVGENYDLMAYHKPEHYPSNFHGVNFQGTVPVTDALKLKGTLSAFEQIRTQITATDTLFGDPFFTSSAGSDKGTIGAERVSADYKWSPELSLTGYAEHAKFRKNALLVSGAIDKDVYNLYGGASLSITKQLGFEASMRHFFCVGNWQTMNFRSHQDIPEIAVRYLFGKQNENRVYLIYHFIGFEDNNGASAGANDYRGHQLVLECKIAL